jgi:hypothetical protein
VVKVLLRSRSDTFIVMHCTATHMESAVRGWIECMQQRKLDELSNYIHSDYRQNGHLFSRDTFSNCLNETGARNFQGQLEEVQVSSDSEWICLDHR